MIVHGIARRFRNAELMFWLLLVLQVVCFCEMIRTCHYTSEDDNLQQPEESSFYETPLNSPDQSYENVSTKIHNGDMDNQDSCSNSTDSSPCDSVDTLVPNQEDRPYFKAQNNVNYFGCKQWQPHLLVKLKNILDGIQTNQMECYKIQTHEKHLLDLCQQLKDSREKLMLENNKMIQSLNELIQIISKNLTNSRSSSSGTSFCCSLADDDHSSEQSNLVGTSRSSLVSTSSTNPLMLNQHYQYKLRKLPAMIKGYLVRRLMATAKVSNLKRTIRDTSAVLLNFKQNLTSENGQLIVTQEDVVFHKRLCIQLEKSCKDFYALFFNTSIAKRMQLISNDRKHLLLNNSNHRPDSSRNSVSSSYSSVLTPLSS